jgi:hypothetical protein
MLTLEMYSTVQFNTQMLTIESWTVVLYRLALNSQELLIELG